MIAAQINFAYKRENMDVIGMGLVLENAPLTFLRTLAKLLIILLILFVWMKIMNLKI